MCSSVLLLSPSAELTRYLQSLLLLLLKTIWISLNNINLVLQMCKYAQWCSLWRDFLKTPLVFVKWTEGLLEFRIIYSFSLAHWGCWEHCHSYQIAGLTPAISISVKLSPTEVLFIRLWGYKEIVSDRQQLHVLQEPIMKKMNTPNWFFHIVHHTDIHTRDIPQGKLQK